MEDKFSRVSGKEMLDTVVRELDRNGGRYNFDNSVYNLSDDHIFMDDFVPTKMIESGEELREYVVDRVKTINGYMDDFIKEKALISVFREIYRFKFNPNFDEFDQSVIDELKDYIYDNSIYPAEKPDEIAYLDIINKGKRR